MKRAQWLAVLLLVLHHGAPAQEPAGQRGGKVQWARLKTASVAWARHSRSDPGMLAYMRSVTSLNIEPRWFIADVAKLDEMTAYPFLFSDGIGVVTDPNQLGNLREYLMRGGFLCIDGCIGVQHDAAGFVEKESAALRNLLPEIAINPLPASHEIYTCYFKMEDRPPHTYFANVFNPQFARHGLYGVFYRDRMAALISISGLQCGWDKMIAPPGHDIVCMRMFANIYTYVLTH